MTFPGHGRLSVSWWGAAAPPTVVSLAATTYIGVGFTTTVPGRMVGIRQYLNGGWGNSKWGILWNQDTDQLMAVGRFRMDGSDPSPAWRQTWLRPWVRLVPGTIYRIACLMTTTYLRHNAFLAAPVTVNGIKFFSSFQSTAINPVLVSVTTNTNANGVDILFQPD
jgi:hypothetical protein